MWRRQRHSDRHVFTRLKQTLYSAVHQSSRKQSEETLQPRTQAATHKFPKPSVPWAEPVRAPDSELVTPNAFDDDVVLDTPESLTTVESAPEGKLSDESLRQLRRGISATRGVGEDVIRLVTDAFQAQREKAVEERRRVLYEITHPQLSDYTYRSRLVPPPPFSFGKITDEAIQLAHQLIVKPSYSLVFQAGTRASSNRVPQLEQSSATCPPSAQIEQQLAGPRTTVKDRLRSAVQRRRERHEEDNMFADHTYFFEINDLYQEVVLVGRANAGKSTLLNALLDQPGMAPSSSTPHTTRRINFYQSTTKDEMLDFCRRERHNLVKLPSGGLQLTFVDIPGYGVEGMSERWRDSAIELTDSYFGVRRSVNTVLFCIDCDSGMTKTDVKYFEWLENVQGVFFIVLTKCDRVPHSRICSVMRQIYALITQNRKKYRKVFPFILPTSATSGENIEELRGFLAETSGMIPGDRLRAILEVKKRAWMDAALRTEARRLEEAKATDRNDVRQFFQTYYQDSEASHLLPLGTSDPTSPTSPLLGTPVDSREPEDEVVSPEGRASPKTEESRAARQDFLRWRREHPHETYHLPFGGHKIRLNSGIEAPRHQWDQLLPEYRSPRSGDGGPPVCAADDGPPPSLSEPPCSRVLGHQPIEGSGSTARRAASPLTFAERLQQFQQTTAAQQPPRRLSGTALVVEDSDGRLAPFTAGQRSGPCVVSLRSNVFSRKAEWKATQLRQLLHRENPEAPWRAADDVRRKLEEAKQNALLSGMTAKASAAYVRNAGRVMDSFETFENDVTAAKYMNEVRQSRTLRSQQQMHLNATAKINYRSMPRGLWKAYGSTNPHLPHAVYAQPPYGYQRVLGRHQDASHAQHTTAHAERLVSRRTWTRKPPVRRTSERDKKSKK